MYKETLLQEEDIRSHIAQLLGSLIGSEVAADQPFMDVGLDSLGAVELRNALSARYSLDLPASLLFDYPNISTLSKYLLAAVQPTSVILALQNPASAVHALDTTGAEVIGMSCHYPAESGGTDSWTVDIRPSIADLHPQLLLIWATWPLQWLAIA